MSLRPDRRLFPLLLFLLLASAFGPVPRSSASGPDRDFAQAHALYAVAVASMLHHHPDEAVALLRRVIELDPDAYEPRVKLGAILLGRDEAEKAVPLIERARDLAPSLPRVGMLLGAAYQKAGRIGDAEVELERVISFAPPEKSPYLLLGGLYQAEEKKEEAARVYETGRRALPDLPEFPFKLGLLSLDGDDPAAAADLFREALAVDPGFGDAWLPLAFALDRQGLGEEAAEWYEKVSRDAPGNTAVYERLWRIYLERGEYNLAAGKLRMLTTLEPLSAQAWFALGMVEHLRGDYGEAVSAFEQARNLGLDSAELYLALGAALERRGRFQDAVDNLEKGISADPNNPIGYNYLGYMYAEKGVRLDEAEELIRRALELDPGNGAFLDSLGWVFYRRGDYRAALENLEKAAEASPDEPEILEHLGDASFRLGEDAAARDYWRRALEAEPEHPERLELKIEEGLPAAPGSAPSP
ncbi:MAG TPA: tetratricopeptide repeat protein [bacterium]|nr:tetratricopeptide repeat protein [bacterium]HPJ71256.1 tetratricopeptide repeat protein [bacterium]HPQ67268.1 tetratricopeptide repeat protein [bacterium]